MPGEGAPRITLRMRPEHHAELVAAAGRAGVKVGPFVTAMALVGLRAAERAESGDRALGPRQAPAPPSESPVDLPAGSPGASGRRDAASANGPGRHDRRLEPEGTVRLDFWLADATGSPAAVCRRLIARGLVEVGGRAWRNREATRAQIAAGVRVEGRRVG